MVTITIDGKQISVDENLSILEAAQEADVKIPTLCYLKDVNEVGACKMCVVEVEGSRHLVTSCNTKVKEGMVVNTHSERVVNSRKQVCNGIRVCTVKGRLKRYEYPCDHGAGRVL
mgnify:CR=1 FL=1